MLHIRVLIVATLVTALSGAAPLLAATAGPVSGQALDAGGRALAGVRIALVRAVEGRPAGIPARVQRTDARGAWSFRSVPAGEYVVRMSHHDRSTGVPVSVSDSTGISGVMIVAPSLRPSEHFSGAQVAAGAAGATAAAGGGGVSTALIVGAVVVAAAAATAVVVLKDES